ncbi:MAG TPA: carboxymuconolactone decarboxylase family protein [Longimicrobiaceae bacterium]|nr:carboxymuconolactone decarboxylase family protein [Longimicrobiaceae bacterium]
MSDPLVALSAALGTRDEECIRAALERAAEEADPVAVEEVLLQAHLFVGFPDALEAMVVWREVSGRPAPDPSREGEPLWEERGAAVCARVYGDNYSALRRNVAALHPDLDRWMVVGGYGRVLGRPGLDLATRELCIAALLATLGAPRQLHSHLRGALNAGASTDEVEAAVDVACALLSEERAAEVRGLWARVKG